MRCEGKSEEVFFPLEKDKLGESCPFLSLIVAVGVVMCADGADSVAQGGIAKEDTRAKWKVSGFVMKCWLLGY